MNILGQEKLLSQINSYTNKTFPKTTILLGDFGCGKHLMSEYVAEMLRIDLVDITEDISLELLEEISLRVVTTLYVIDATQIDERKQNMILKFLEEPSSYAFIMLLVEDRVNLLPTVLNRCTILEFEQYSKDVLLNFIDNSVDTNLALNVCNTPGQLKRLKMTNLSELYELCLKMVYKTEIASFPNTLTISNKLNYTDEFDKYDAQLFLKMLIYVIITEYQKTNNPKILKMYYLTNEYIKKLRYKKLNKKHLIENYLTRLWQEVRI